MHRQVGGKGRVNSGIFGGIIGDIKGSGGFGMGTPKVACGAGAVSTAVRRRSARLASR